jgi:hypothetical protein
VKPCPTSIKDAAADIEIRKGKLNAATSVRRLRAGKGQEYGVNINWEHPPMQRACTSKECQTSRHRAMSGLPYQSFFRRQQQRKQESGGARIKKAEY